MPDSPWACVHLAQHLQIAVGLAPGVELDRAVAELEQLADELDVGVGVGQQRGGGVRRNPGAEPAEQLMQGYAGPLCGDVPQRDVERRLGTRQHRQREILEAVPDGLALLRIGSQDARRQVPQGLQDGEIEAAGRVGRSGSEAFDPAVVEHPHDRQRAVLLVEVGRPAVAVDVGANGTCFYPLDHDLIIDHICPSISPNRRPNRA